MKKTLLTALAVALLLGTSSRLHAADPASAGSKPVLVVSLNSLDELLNDVDFIGKIAEMPQVRFGIGLLKGQVDEFSKGLDRKRAMGLVVSVVKAGDESEFQPVGLIPVTDLKTILDTVKSTGVTVEDAGDGVFEVQAGPIALFVKERDGWALIAQKPESFASIPSDPGKLLAGLAKDYDLAARAYVQNVPDEYRKIAIDALNAGVAFGGKQGGESDEDYELRMQYVKAAIKSIETVINDSNEVTLGWTLDAKNERTFIDFSWTAVAGSKTAKQFAGLTGLKSNFSGFLHPEAAVTVNLAQKFDTVDAAEGIAMIKSLEKRALQEIERNRDIPDDARKAIEEMFTDAMGVLYKTLEGGKFDAAAALLLDPEAMTFIAGGHVVDAEKLEGVLKKAVELAKNEPDFPGVKFDAATHKDVRFHTMSVPMPDAKAQRVFGEKLDVVVGIGKTAIYVGVGKEAIDTLKSAIDKSVELADKSVDPMQLTVSLTPIMNFVASVEGSDTTKKLAETVAKHKGKDRVLLTVKGIENGEHVRFEIEGGVLRLIAEAVKSSGPFGPGF